MGLAVCEIMKGAQVAVAFDDRGKRVWPQRKGIIVRVDTWVDETAKDWEENGDPRNGVRAIYVQFGVNEKPVEVQARHLALIRPFDQTQYGRMKRDEQNKKAKEAVENAESDEDMPLVMIDKTGVPDSKPLSESDVDQVFEPAELRSDGMDYIDKQEKRKPGRPRKIQPEQ